MLGSTTRRSSQGAARSAANVLHAAGIKNWLQHDPVSAEGRAGMPIAPRTLFVFDEGSLVSMHHLARIIDLAEKHGCKVFVTGDHEQLSRPSWTCPLHRSWLPLRHTDLS